MDRLSRHVNPIPNYVPKLDAVLRHVRKTDRGDHWYVRDGKRPPVRHNYRSHAFIKLRAPASAATLFRDRGEYCVARLLIELTLPPFPPRTGFTNNCGLPECVNPQHWTPHIVGGPKWRFSMAGAQWQLVVVRNGKPAEDAVVLRARDSAGIVHVFNVAPLSERSLDVLPTALCGSTFYPLNLIPVDAAVTCTKGC